MPKLIDRTGQRFNRLVVISRAESRNKETYWLCKCDCGTDKIVRSNSLVSGFIKSCGCYHKESASKQGKSRTIDLSGQNFGRLTAIKRIKSKWLCRCLCGNFCNVSTVSLRNGHTTSCGCYIKEKMRTGLRTTHGQSYTKEYKRRSESKRNEIKRNLDSKWTTEMEVELTRFFPNCVICGLDSCLSTDHLLPLSKGYGLSPSNAVRLCVKCNSSKKNKDISELPEHIQYKLLEASRKFNNYWSSR